MKNKKLFTLLFLVFFIFILSTYNSFSFGKGQIFHQIGTDKPCFKKLNELNSFNKPSLFSFDLDIQLGLGIATSSFNLNKVDSNSVSLNTNKTKIGPSIGATVSLNLLGFGFSTGIVYSSKGFQSSSGTNYDLHYFVMPWLIYFDMNFKKVRLNGNFGPYVGILLSKDSYINNNVNLFTPKNIDFGLTANVQGAYFFTKILGALLGVKYEFGGLNNLASTEYIKSLHTSTFFIYTGLKISL